MRPDPRTPAMPKISPRCSVNVADPGSSAVTSRMASPRVRCVRGNKSSTGRPTMRATMSSCVASFVVPPPAFRPSRSTMKRSATLFTSSMKWEM